MGLTIDIILTIMHTCIIQYTASHIVGVLWETSHCIFHHYQTWKVDPPLMLSFQLWKWGNTTRDIMRLSYLISISIFLAIREAYKKVWNFPYFSGLGGFQKGHCLKFNSNLGVGLVLRIFLRSKWLLDLPNLDIFLSILNFFNGKK